MENIDSSLDLMKQNLLSLSRHIEDIQLSRKIGIRIINAQEEERKRVARELHDSPAQILSNVVMRAEICDKLIEKDVSKARIEISNLRKTVQDCLEDVKRIVYDLRPLSLTENGLIETLEDYSKEFSKESKIEIHFKSDITKKIDNEELSLTLFRVVQECLSNAKKHSGASKITIYLGNTLEHIEMLVADNGDGFDIEGAKKISVNSDHGFGLVSMKERLKLLNGQLEIISSRGQGSKFLFKIPYTDTTDFEGGTTK